jgi:hypothetical protein
VIDQLSIDKASIQSGHRAQQPKTKTWTVDDAVNLDIER